MLIPVRCISCGKPVAGLWEKYNKKIKDGTSVKDALDEVGLERYCCRTLFMTHVDVLKDIAEFRR